MAKDRLFRSVYSVGFLGIGKYNTVNNQPAYKRWKRMLERCYNKEYLLNNPTYINCIVIDKWHNFQNFAKWFKENCVTGYHLDKDLINLGNKVYSPDNCIFVPQELNSLLIDSKKKNRSKYGIGVKQTPSGKYTVHTTGCNDIVRETIEEAKTDYLMHRNKRIKKFLYFSPRIRPSLEFLIEENNKEIEFLRK